MMRGLDIRKNDTDVPARPRYRTPHSYVNRSSRQLDEYAPTCTAALQVFLCCYCLFVRLFVCVYVCLFVFVVLVVLVLDFVVVVVIVVVVLLLLVCLSSF